MVEILVNGRSGKTAVVPLDDERPLVIGRRGSLRIADRQISRQHARVVRRDDAWYVEDLGSKNGTYINQVRVKRTERVQPGDIIRIGNTSMVVRQAAPPASSPPTMVPLRRRRPIEVPDRAAREHMPLALQPTNAGDVAGRRWGPTLLAGMTLALLISLLVNAIAYTRTMSALRNIESDAQRRAEQRDVDLIEALRSDLRRPPAGYAELAAAVDRSAWRTDETSRAAREQANEQFAQLHRSTNEQLAELRRTLDGLNKRLEGTSPQPTDSTAMAAGATPTDMAVRTAPKPAADPLISLTATSTPRADAAPPDVVFVIDASRGLAGALPQTLAQVRAARAELAPHQRSRILVAREAGVVELEDDRLASAAAEHIAKTDDAEGTENGSPVGRAVAIALQCRPRTLHLFTDNPGGGANDLRDLLRATASGATSVNVTHFHTRQFREDLKALARDHGGMYAFIGQS